MEAVKQGIPEADWDSLLQQIGGHFLQSRAWAEFQASLNRPTFYCQGEGWQWLAAVRQAKGIKYCLSGYGPTVQQHSAEALGSLKQFGRDHGLDFVRCEPNGQVTKEEVTGQGGRKIADVQPEHTWILDLQPGPEELRRGLSSGHRNSINQAEKRGIEITSSTEVDLIAEFLKMQTDTAARSKIQNYPDWYYRKLAETLLPSGHARFLTAEFQGQKVAMALVYDWGETRYYAHAAAYQALNRQANAAVPLVWQAILEAKSSGKTKFDFWGVAPTDDPRHPWHGISYFKKAFGGGLVSRLGTYDFPLNKAKYGLYSIYRRLRGRQDG